MQIRNNYSCMQPKSREDLLDTTRPTSQLAGQLVFNNTSTQSSVHLILTWRDDSCATVA